MQCVASCLLSLSSPALYVLCHSLSSPYPNWTLISPKSFSFGDHKDQGCLCDQKRAAHGISPSLHAILLQLHMLFPAAGRMTGLFLGSGEAPSLEVGCACSHRALGEAKGPSSLRPHHCPTASYVLEWLSRSPGFKLCFLLSRYVPKISPSGPVISKGNLRRLKCRLEKSLAVNWERRD